MSHAENLAPAFRLDPPFRAEHIGSFLRPPALLKARAAHDAGTLSAAVHMGSGNDTVDGGSGNNFGQGLFSAWPTT